MEKKKLKKLILSVLPFLALLVITSRMFYIGWTVAEQFGAHLIHLRGEIYILSSVMMSVIRELAPVAVGMTFCMLAPLMLLLSPEKNNKLLHKSYWLVLLIALPVCNVFAIASGMYGAYVFSLNLDIFPAALTTAKESIHPADFITSFVKIISFVAIFCGLAYFLSKRLLKDRKILSKIIFVVVFAVLSFILVFVADIGIMLISCAVGGASK